jgi:hypothetical protein
VYERSEGVLDRLGSRLLRDRGRGEDDADAVDFPRLLRKCSEGPGDHAPPSNEMNSRRLI